MTRFFLSFALSFSLGALAALSATMISPPDAAQAPASVVRPVHGVVELQLPEGDWEFDAGTFSLRNGHAHPSAFVWQRDVSGTTIETRICFRPNQADGWVYCGSNDLSVDVSYEYEGDLAHGDVEAFKTWAEGQYDPAMLVDKDIDFLVTEHTIVTL